MNILTGYTTNNLYTNTQRSVGNYNAKNHSNQLQSNKNDLFVRNSSVISPKFQGRTGNGNFLREITGLRDPYSGVIILTQKQWENIKYRLSKETSIRKKLKILSEHQDSMFPVEKEMYERFCMDAKKDKSTTFKQIILSQKDFALWKLIQEENKIFDKIEEASIGITPEHQKKVKELIDSARITIREQGKNSQQFKRKSFVHNLVRVRQDELLDKIEKKMALSPYNSEDMQKICDARFGMMYCKYDTNINGKTPLDLIKELQIKYIPETLNEKDDTLPLIDIAHKLPSSKNSINAFIVKYNERSDREIGERILDQSVMTIEHITAYSRGGENEAENFMAATKLTNEDKSDTPLKEYKKHRKNIAKHLQEYTNDIINAGHRGELQGHEWYPYLFRDRIKDDADIKLDISGYKIPPEIAFRTLPPRLRDKYPKYLKYIPERTEPLNKYG